MSKKFIFFVGVIFIIVFGVMQVATISMLDKDNTVVLLSGIMGLLGGIIGAMGAYLIAKEQIKKQDSVRKMDLKIKNYEVIIGNLHSFVTALDEFYSSFVEWDEEINSKFKNMKSKLNKYYNYFFLIDFYPNSVEEEIRNKMKNILVILQKQRIYFISIGNSIEETEELYRNLNLMIPPSKKDLEKDASLIDGIIKEAIFKNEIEEIIALKNRFEEEIEKIIME